MAKYEILYWQPVLTGCSTVPLPSFVAVPDVELLNVIRENNNQIEVKVEGTGIPGYDGMTFLATVDRSAMLPNARPNFYLATGAYLFTLTHMTTYGTVCARWLGFPIIASGKNKSGSFSVINGPYQSYTPLSRKVSPPKDTTLVEYVDKVSLPASSKPKKSVVLFLVGVFFVLVFALLFRKE